MAPNACWYDQDLILANIFLHVKPSELFNANATCRHVCQSWNYVITGEEFCRFYFEKSFCVSEPFINDGNRDQFSDLDELEFNSDEIFSNTEVDEYMMDEDYEIEEAEAPVKEPLSTKECLKYLEEVSIGGKMKLNFTWKNNFYRRFLTLVSLITSDKVQELVEVPLSRLVTTLLEPLTQPQRDKLNLLLKKWRLSKLLTDSAKSSSDNLVMFNDSGMPHVLKLTSKLYLGNLVIMTSAKTGFDPSVSTIIPGISETENKVLGDVFCGLFPNLLLQKKQLEIRRPLSAYMIFCSAKREQIKQENPSMSFVEIAKLMGMRWKEMNDSEKGFYLEQASIKKAEYQRQLEEHVYIVKGLD